MRDDEDAIYVEHEGLAVVHQGERIIAAPGAEAMLSHVSGTETHYHFPIHVVHVADVGEDVKQEIEGRVWDGLNSALS
jgi:hypothetical protein